MKDLTDNWRKVEDVLADAVSIAWDGCHKIYVLLDEEQHDLMQEYGYDLLLRVDEFGVDACLKQLQEWYDASCFLRFVSSVSTVPGNPNDGFTRLIAQGEDEEGVIDDDVE